MCGICGIKRHDGQHVDQAVLQQMNYNLIHRGPDGDGFYIDGAVGLAMRRLSIIDIAGSDQPLYNEDGSIAVIFNGELYNYRENRKRLKDCGHVFYTEGDGETIAHLYEEYGMSVAEHLRGQFAFALWDAPRNRLLLARDRLGQKPLYYYQDEKIFVFASEIKAILAHPGVPRSAIFDDPEMLALYLGYGYVPAPLTAFKGICALPPGHYLLLQDAKIHIQPYWSLPCASEESGEPDNTEVDWIERVRAKLDQATQMRLIADVPLGAFLSGGLDSSLIVAIMQKHTNTAVKTFSIGFEGDESFDETPYASAVARFLGTEHTSFIVKPTAMELLPELVWHYDQPFADSSAIPTYLVSELTRRQVTVALTGDGGDELFAGYERFYAAALARKLRSIPQPLWKFAATAIGVLPEGTGYYNTVKRFNRFVRGASQPLAMAYFDWARLFSPQWIEDLVGLRDVAGEHFVNRFQNGTTVAQLLDANMATYLPDNLLIKADRCSMAASLESRAPFLDHELVELAARIPLHLKLNNRTTKYILKKIAAEYLPARIIHRKKHGFGAPVGAWLKQDSKPVRDLLLDPAARARNLFGMEAIQRLLIEHETGRYDHGQQIWTLLTLEWWYRLFINARKPLQL